ncbi:MAG: hypothetical protein AAGC70_16320 [Pseudomonadota bacterium]
MGVMKPPGLITFLLAVALAAVAVTSYLGIGFAGFGLAAFWVLLAAFTLLCIGCLVRGL